MLQDDEPDSPQPQKMPHSLMKEKSESHYAVLIEKVLDQQASTEEFRSLESAIISRPEVRDLYLELSSQHTLLRQTSGAGLLTPLSHSLAAPQAGTVNENLTKSPKHLRYQIGMAIASLAAVLALAYAWITPPVPSEDSHGKLTKSASARWGECTLPTTTESFFGAGELELLEGTAEIILHSGVSIQLEAPVRFEILNAMKTYVHYGTAVANVPDGAEGFRMDTPDAEVTDFGTIFAVSVNATGQSTVDVIEGEVEIFRPTQQIRQRLTDKKESWEMSRPPTPLEAPQHFLPLSAGTGRHGSVIANNDQSHLQQNLLLVKHPGDTSHAYTRKAYLRFDLTQANLEQCRTLSLSLNQVQSPYGLAAFVTDCHFTIHMLKTEETWPDTLTWQTAPASDLNNRPFALDRANTQPIGTFTIPEGQQEGQIEVPLDKLPMNTLENRQSLTLIITRDTAETSKLGLAHAFSNQNSLTAQEPRLILHKH